MQTAVQLTFAFEIASMQLTPTFKMGALQLRPASKVVTMRLPGSAPQPAMNLQVTFEIARIQPAGGTLGSVKLTPSQQQRPTVVGSPSFTVGGLHLVSDFAAAPLQLTPSQQGQAAVHVIAPFQIATVEFSPSFEISSIVLNSNSKQVSVQMPTAGGAAIEGAPVFEISNLQLTGSGEIGMMQLNLLGQGPRRAADVFEPQFSPVARRAPPAPRPTLVATSSTIADLEPFGTALGTQRHLMDYAVTPRVTIQVRLPSFTSNERLLDRLLSADVITSINLTPWLSSDTDLEQLAFLAVYPSGEVRAISGQAMATADGTIVNFADPVSYFDPALSEDAIRNEGTMGFDIIALQLPSIT